MLVLIHEFLTSQQAAAYRARLLQAEWTDGQVSAGSLSGKVKNNRQLPDKSADAIGIGNELTLVMGSHPTFVSAVMPKRIHPPRFNRYGVGQSYGAHVDGSIMAMSGTDKMLRSDVSATVFMTPPEDYEGGELVIETEYGAQSVKLPAGDMVIYPSGSLHRVMPVSQGERIAAVVWAQSMIRDSNARALLYDMDVTIQSMTGKMDSADRDLLRLTSIYHNLVRRWADA
jgi:PKHD-type hydroxylase